MQNGLDQGRRDAVVEKMGEVGIKRSGFRVAVRAQLQKYLDLHDRQCEDDEKGFPLEDPPYWPRPTGWRRTDLRDNRGRDWVAFDCVEPYTSTLSPDKLKQYAELWFYFDSLDDLIILRLYRMTVSGRMYEVDMNDLFFGSDGVTCALMECVDNSIFADGPT